MGRHSKKTASLGALALVGAGFVAIQVSTSAISTGVSEGWDALKDVVGSDIPVRFEIETDPEKLMGPPSQWTVPVDSSLPDFPEGSCSTLDEVAQDIDGAEPIQVLLRVTMTGKNADEQVVIRRIYPRVVETEEMDSFMVLNCPQGGPIPATTAVVSFVDPGATSYQDENQEPITHFAYALADGEPTDVYVQRFPMAETGRVKWDLMVDYSVDGEDHIVNVNDTLGMDPFVNTNSCGASDDLQWAGEWEGSGPVSC